MDVKRVRAKMGRELDEVLNAFETLTVKKEPVLPTPQQDRTEWLLWCAKTYNCSMDEANKRYWNSHTQMMLIVSNTQARRKARVKQQKAYK